MEIVDKNIAHDHINMQVFRLLEDIEVAGQLNSPRGLPVKEVQLATLSVDPKYSLMNFAPRAFNWKYFCGEVAWYLKQDRSIDFINNFSSFWNGIAPDGMANSNYGSILFGNHPDSQFTKGDFDPGINEMEWVYDCLVSDEYSRQAVAFLNSPCYQYKGNKDFVCTLYLNFWIRKNTLDMKVQMRSNDIFFGLTYDAPWFSALMQSMYLNLKAEKYPKLQLGYYYHSADNIHYYERHFDLANQILDAKLDDSLGMTLKAPLFTFVSDESRGLQKPKYRLQISQEAANFVKSVEDAVASENFKTLKQSDFKHILSQLFTFS